MQQTKGNIWTLAEHPLSYIVIPVNIGWRRDGTNVMGKGLAAQAKCRWPELELELGARCMQLRDNLCVYAYRPKTNRPRSIIFFPTKPLDKARPHLSWQGKADIRLVEKSLCQLANVVPTLQPEHASIFIPDVGCGYGGLRVTEVRPLIQKYLCGFNRVIHVIQQRKATSR